MSADILSPKELTLTCNAALAVIDDLSNRLPDLDEEQEENAEDASERLQSIVNALEPKTMTPAEAAKWKAQLSGRLLVEGARDLSDAELHRCLDQCVSGPACVRAAIFLREAGLLTQDDITNEPQPATPSERLEYLRGELRAERISYGELSELQGLAKYIDPGDVELLEAAGVPEFGEEREQQARDYAATKQPATAEGEGAPLKSPEETGVYKCACGNTERFIGVDVRGYGGPEVCTMTPECTAEECAEDTELRQRFDVLSQDGTREGAEIEYGTFDGGGYDAEIGSYTSIECRDCNAVIWKEPAQPTTPHTATPWKIEFQADASGEGTSVCLADGNGNWIADFGREESLQAQVDADFALTAVNAHAALVEALRVAEVLISRDIIRDDAGCLNKVRAALALAGK